MRVNDNPHGGDVAAVCRQLGLKEMPEIRLDFSVNLNPAGPPPALWHVLMRGVETAAVYPEADAHRAAAALAEAHGVDPAQVLVGNGSTEGFAWILRALRPTAVTLVTPCYAGYEEVCRACGVPVSERIATDFENGFALSSEALGRARGTVLFVGSPNNPTGHLVDPGLLRAAAAECPDRIVVVDESFMDFAVASGGCSLIARDLPRNLVVVKSLTKFFALPGLRLGMVCAHPETAARLAAVRLPWSVNGLAQDIVPRLYQDADYVRRSRQATVELRDLLCRELGGLDGCQVISSAANFVLMRLPAAWPVARLQRELMKRGILIRSCENVEGLGAQWCRLAVRPRSEVEELMRALEEIGVRGQGSGVQGSGVRQDTLNRHAYSETLTRDASLRPRRAAAIMVVGTTSNAGKSIIAAALCRYAARRDWSVAPFKAQNMSLNSFVTPEGGEMGRAQVVQAAAAGIPPHTDMNPVLLKPAGDNGSQVIVDGHAIDHLKAREYYAMKMRMRAVAHAAYDRLAASHDLIVLEGAGSPAEINLMAEDFVNMDMAAYAGARTVLVADIDRGGVFASILGTIALLPARHRRLLAGVIVNKFRGDQSLLDSGIRDIEAMTGVPVLGVMPYLHDLRIEDEDSLGLEQRPEAVAPVLDVAVIRLPRISNFTDFLDMEGDRGVRVRFVDEPARLGCADLIVLPGTKHTRADLQWLHDSGMSAALCGARAAGTPIFGICGGYQMLGRVVSDDDGVEGAPGETPGLGFLPLVTRMGAVKELAQVEGVTRAGLPFAAAGTPFHGYEIHAGDTRVDGAASAPFRILKRRGGAVDEAAGAVSDDGLVCGCYVHGLFDDQQLRGALWRWVCERRGISADAVTPQERSASAEFDRLADTLARHVKLDGLI
ncbi:MAG: cobyric acid synthase [Kiritimatiellae bacterium]|nr:cobyric acid synthase [Kiritimatiellia bacterium]